MRPGSCALIAMVKDTSHRLSKGLKMTRDGGLVPPLMSKKDSEGIIIHTVLYDSQSGC